MKKEYVTPTMVCEEFAANEYVAACGDENKVYKFVCDAPAGTLYYYKYSDGNVDGVYTGRGSATRLGERYPKRGSYHPCEESHEASTTDSFYDGYIDYNNNKRHDRGEGVIVWRGPRGDNGHATAQLDMSSWQTAKS